MFLHCLLPALTRPRMAILTMKSFLKLFLWMHMEFHNVKMVLIACTEGGQQKKTYVFSVFLPQLPHLEHKISPTPYQMGNVSNPES